MEKQPLQLGPTTGTPSGPTADRPHAGLYIGYMFFDTTLNKPIWVKSLGPTVWVDGSGSVV